MVLAIDAQLAAHLEAEGVPHYLMETRTSAAQVSHLVWLTRVHAGLCARARLAGCRV